MLKRMIALFAALVLLLSLAPAALAENGDKKAEVQTEFRITVEKSDYSVVEGLDKDVLNILLLGTDSDGALNYGRSDAMIICSIHKKTGLIQLSSIARDLYVDIPNSNITDRINTANSYGGPLLAMKAVNEALGLNIEHYVTINFSSFEKVVEILEGVDIEISNAEANEINKRLGKNSLSSGGLVHMNGEQALAYVRIRNLDNNFGRNNRQRIFLQAVLDKVLKEKDIFQIIELIDVCLDYMDYNLGFMDVVSIAWTVLTKGVTLDMYSCPASGQYHYETIEGKGSVVIGKMEDVRETLHAFIYGAE